MFEQPAAKESVQGGKKRVGAERRKRKRRGGGLGEIEEIF